MFVKSKNIYKCRLCGKQFEKEKHEDLCNVIKNEGILSPYDWHECEDGRVGFSDLLGTYGAEVLGD